MPQGALKIYGTDKLRALGVELRTIGGPTARGIRSGTRKGIVAAAKPMQRDVQAAYRSIPVKGEGSTGLRNALAKATQLKILISSRTALVRIWVNPARMPEGKQSLVAMMEGLKPWRHPVYPRGSNRAEWAWVQQAPHPTFYPTVRRREAAVRAATVVAVKATLAQLPKEM